MKHLWGIIVVCALALMVQVGVSRADDYVEDVYFWQDAQSQSADGELVPNYNPRAKEIIFIEDSTTAQHPDTVRAIIREIR